MASYGLLSFGSVAWRCGAALLNRSLPSRGRDRPLWARTEILGRTTSQVAVRHGSCRRWPREQTDSAVGKRQPPGWKTYGMPFLLLSRNSSGARWLHERLLGGGWGMGDGR